MKTKEIYKTIEDVKDILRTRVVPDDKKMDIVTQLMILSQKIIYFEFMPRVYIKDFEEKYMIISDSISYFYCRLLAFKKEAKSYPIIEEEEE